MNRPLQKNSNSKYFHGFPLRESLSALLVFCFICLTPSLGTSQTTKLTITPELIITETYNDNINLDSSYQKSDKLTSVSAQLKTKLQSSSDNFNFTYTPSAISYNSYSENNTVRHNASMQYTHFFTKHFTLSMEDNYISTEENIEPDRESQTARKTRRKYQRNNARASLTYQFAKNNNFSVGGSFQTLENDDPLISDAEHKSVFASTSFAILTKSKIFLMVQADEDIAKSIASVSTESKSNNYSETISYTYNTSKLTDYYLKYRHAHRTTSGSDLKSAVHNFTSGLNSSLNSTTSVNFEGGYYVREANSIKNSDGMIFIFNLNTKAKRWNLSLNANAGWDEDYMEAGTRGYTEYKSVSGNYDYQLGKHLSFSTGMSHRINTDTNGLEGATLTGNANINWSFLDYYSLNLGYTHRKHSDDIATAEYISNQIFLSFHAAKDFKHLF